jgi:hypothetical protein
MQGTPLTAGGGLSGPIPISPAQLMPRSWPPSQGTSLSQSAGQVTRRTRGQRGWLVAGIASLCVLAGVGGYAISQVSRGDQTHAERHVDAPAPPAPVAAEVAPAATAPATPAAAEPAVPAPAASAPVAAAPGTVPPASAPAADVPWKPGPTEKTLIDPAPVGKPAAEDGPGPAVATKTAPAPSSPGPAAAEPAPDTAAPRQAVARPATAKPTSAKPASAKPAPAKPASTASPPTSATRSAKHKESDGLFDSRH